jgi:uncharacterized repeat protein (TIGR01451 family)
MFANIFSHTKRLLSSLALAVAAIVLSPSIGWAQSGCTAMWATVDNDNGGAGTVASLRYFNTSTNRWINLNPAVTLVGNSNAMTTDPSSGLIYYMNRTDGTMHSYNINTQSDTLLGVVPLSVPIGVTDSFQILGATMVGAGGPGNLYLYYTTNGPLASQLEFVGRVTQFTPSVLVSWTQILTINSNTNPVLANSGDLFTNQSGQSFIASNTNPNSFWSLDLNPASGTYARVTQTLALSSTNSTLWGAATNPANGQIYIGYNTTTLVTSSVNTVTGVTTVLDNQSVYGVTDMGNCAPAPAKPAISKTFNPVYQPGVTGTTTLQITLANSNTAPVWLFTDFVDTLPAGMVVGSPSNLNAGACASTTTVTNVITATSGLTAVTFAAGGRIPAGGCTISLTVSATAVTTPYVNTIPVGALNTTAGANTTATTASFKVGTDFSAVKSQCQGICGVTTTSAISTYGNQTHQYVLTITNSTAGGTGTVSFTDTLPTLITPVLSITAGASGGGTCTTASAVVGGATQITGTFGNAPAGAQCTITVTALVNPQAGSITVTNTLTVAPTVGTGDTNPANNTAFVLTNVGPSTVLTVTKTNGVSTVVAGSTTSYTVTVSNLGPANAPNSIVKDLAVPGLSCTAVTCPVGNIVGTATCPASLTIPLLQGTGLVIPTFNAGSSVTFVVTCDVTATGQ